MEAFITSIDIIMMLYVQHGNGHVAMLSQTTLKLYKYILKYSVAIVMKARDDNSFKAIFNFVIYRVHD